MDEDIGEGNVRPLHLPVNARIIPERRARCARSEKNLLPAARANVRCAALQCRQANLVDIDLEQDEEATPPLDDAPGDASLNADEENAVEALVRVSGILPHTGGE